MHPITAVQTEYSLWTRDPETNGVLATCRELGIGFVPYSPLGRGFLSGRFSSLDEIPDDDFRKYNPRFAGEAFEQNMKLADKVEEIADEKGITPGAARARVGARPGRGPRADPGHEAASSTSRRTPRRPTSS